MTLLRSATLTNRACIFAVVAVCFTPVAAFGATIAADFSWLRGANCVPSYACDANSIQGLIYPDGTCRDAREVAAVMN